LPVFEMLNANGNQLGEVGCELLQAEMDLANQGHKLDELDEDNEPDDDDDEDEDDDDNEMDNGITFDEFKLKPSYRNYTQLGKDRDEMIIKHVGKSAETVAQFAIGLIQGHAQDQAKSDQMDVADAFHKLMRHLYSTNSEIVATTELLTEVGLMKATSTERRRRLTKQGDLANLLKPLYRFLLAEIKKDYFPQMAKKYLSTFFSRPETFKLVQQSDCVQRTELVAQLYKF